MNNHRLRTLHAAKIAAAAVLIAIMALLAAQKAAAAGKDGFPYLIKVNRYHNTITVYTRDDEGAYNVPVKAFVCSVGQKGTKTVLGTFQTKEKYRWKALMGDVWGQYSTRIVGGILFHSVYYYQNGNPGTLAVKEYNKLGSPASHGCIRLTVEGAKWIYDNCPVGTTVIIYDGKDSPGPLGKPVAIKLPGSIRWDPTDPNSNNPFKNKIPVLKGVKEKSTAWGMELDLLEGISAKSSVGSDITSGINVEGMVDYNTAGKYVITYSVTDALGRTAKKKTKITVKEPKAPVFSGIEDHAVPDGTVITREYVLNGVTASVSGKAIDTDEIDVTFDMAEKDICLVTYTISLKEGVYGTASAFYVIDGEAPVFTGISDRILNPGQIPDASFALSGVSAADNHTGINPKDIKVKIEEIPWEDDLQDDQTGSEPAGSRIAFLITYEVSDEVGNLANVTAVFHY